MSARLVEELCGIWCDAEGNTSQAAAAAVAARVGGLLSVMKGVLDTVVRAPRTLPIVSVMLWRPTSSTSSQHSLLLAFPFCR